jgi:hypothetical protein
VAAAQALVESLRSPFMLQLARPLVAASYKDQGALRTALEASPRTAGVYNAMPELCWRLLQLGVAVSSLACNMIAGWGMLAVTGHSLPSGALKAAPPRTLLTLEQFRRTMLS